MSQKVVISGVVMVLLATLGILAYGLFFASDPKEIPSVLIDKKAAPFSFTTFEGNPVSLEQFHGQPVVLNFWASWCAACRVEAPILETAYQTYGPKGVVFIGIAINDKREDSLAFIRRYNKSYILGPDDASGSISLDYGVTAVPETYLINRKGVIQHKQLGIISRSIIEEFVESQLAEGD